MDNVINMIKGLEKLIIEIKSTYESNDRSIDFKESEVQDLLHELELSSLNAASLSKVARDLRDAKRERRRMRNENELIEPLYDYLIKKLDLLPELKKLIEGMGKSSERIQSRIYTPRVREDLKISQQGKYLDRLESVNKKRLK